MIIVYWIAIALLILMSAFFSGTETSLVSTRKTRMEILHKNGSRAAGRALYILDHMEDAIGMVLIGNNIANISATAFIVYLFSRAYAFGDTGLMGVTAAQAILFLVACEVSPKIVARSLAGSYLMFFSYPVIILMTLMKPLIKVSLIFTRFIQKSAGAGNNRQTLATTREEIDILFRIGEQEGIIEEEDQEFVSEILSFRELTAVEVMTPTIDIISVEEKSSLRQLVELIVESKFTRIPVYEERVDNITGYVFYRDILTSREIESIRGIMYDAVYVPATKRISKLLQEMQEENIPLVFVVNEYGGVIGMVTHEDIAEEVVGEIEARENVNEDLIVKVKKNRFLINGDLDIEYFMKQFSVKIEKKGFETVAGFITCLTGSIPKQGDRVEYGNYTFIIDEATPRSVERVVMVAGKKKKL